MLNKFKAKNNFLFTDPRRVLNCDKKLGEVYRLGTELYGPGCLIPDEAFNGPIFFVPTEPIDVGFYGRVISRTPQGTYKVEIPRYYCANWEVTLKLFSKRDIKDAPVILALANEPTS